jgi:hypothetical protein
MVRIVDNIRNSVGDSLTSAIAAFRSRRPCGAIIELSDAGTKTARPHPGHHVICVTPPRGSQARRPQRGVAAKRRGLTDSRGRRQSHEVMAHLLAAAASRSNGRGQV